MDVITGEFKDLSSCFLLNVHYNGKIAILAGHKIYGLVQLSNNLTYSLTPKQSGLGDISDNTHIQDIKFNKGTKYNLIAEASDDNIILHDCTVNFNLNKSSKFLAHRRSITCLDWNDQNDLLATSSLDNLLHVWDTRKSRRAPIIILNSSTSATKIAWEKTAGDLLASTHENQLKVWDIRGRTDQPLSIYVNRETDLGAQCFGNLDFFNARSRRILSIDFSPNKRNVIVTGSADSVVRVLEINKASNTDAADVIFQMPQKRWPVVSVKQTPFGDGLVTLVWNKTMDGYEPLINSKYNIYYGRENNLTLWTSHHNNRVPAGTLVHTFYGHNDLILEQDWVVDRGSGNEKNIKLITWSKDNTLKLWPISDNIKEMCGHKDSGLFFESLEKSSNHQNNMQEVRHMSEEPSKSEEIVTRDTGYRSESVISSHSKQSSTEYLEEIEDEVIDAQESCTNATPGTGSKDNIDCLSRKFSPPMNQQTFLADLNAELQPFIHGDGFGDRVSVETSDLRGDPYTVLVGDTTNHHAYLKVKYPKGYPLLGESPQFSFITGTSLDQATAFDIQQKMQISAQHLVSKKQRCLEACFKLFEREVDGIFQKEKEAISMPGTKIQIPKGNDAIPFPRTSGGRFCGLGQLVCFGWTYSVQISNVTKSSSEESVTSNNLASRLARTPRALSALSDTSHLMSARVRMIGSTPPYKSGKIPSSFVSGSSDASNSQFPSMNTSQKVNNLCRQPSRVSFDSKLLLREREDEMNMFNQYVQYQNRFSAQEEGLTKCSRNMSSNEEPKKVVTVYDSLRLLPFDRRLADEYQLCGPNLKNVCIYNAQVALKHGYRKIAECWKIVANCCKDTEAIPKTMTCSKSMSLKHANAEIQFSMLAKKKITGTFRSWAQHPGGKTLLNEVILKYSNQDFQTAAMICSVFANASNKNVHLDGGTFFSTYFDETSNGKNQALSNSMEAIVKRNKEIIHKESNPKAAAIAARQLRKAQRFKGLRNLSECQSESQDIRTIKDYPKEIDSVVSDGDNQINAFAGANKHGLGERIASSVANTNLLNIPGIFLNFTSKSPIRKQTRSISVTNLNRSYSEVNVAEDFEGLKGISLNETSEDDTDNIKDCNQEQSLLDPSFSGVYDQLRSIYADMLHRCGIVEKAVEIRNLIENPSLIDTERFIMHKPPEKYWCPNCTSIDNPTMNLKMYNQRRCWQHSDVRCVYCRLPVKGQVSACLTCGHGGHLNHMMEWFENNHSCATSCGCNCLNEIEQSICETRQEKFL